MTLSQVEKVSLSYGQAGTGKTYLTKIIIEKLEKAGKKIVKLAPTNKACRLIGGKTIHKFYLQNHQQKILKNLINVDYIVVNEISMVKEIFYRYFTLIKRYVPSIKFIIVGDFRQLSPVNDRFTGSYIDSPVLYQLCDANRLVLNTCRRSDTELFNLYQDVNNVKASKYKAKTLTFKNICFLHSTRKAINKKCMKQFIKNKQFIKVNASGKNKKTQETYLTVGTPIVSYRNDSDLDIYNTDVFTITKINIDKNTFTFTDGETMTKMSCDEFSDYFYPAFCITTHTSQGQTYNEDYTIHDWGFMDERLKYVALSRATSIKNIKISV
jgi:ATP-dependent exoDNAse (exonuclease V) alpha subunit